MPLRIRAFRKPEQPEGRQSEEKLAETAETNTRKMIIKKVDPNRPNLTTDEQDAMENLLVKEALAMGLRVKLPSGKIIHPKED